MRIAVTGGAGFIGSNLTRHLVETLNANVLVIDKLTYAGNLESLADLVDHDRFQLLVSDVCDSAAVGSAITDFRPDAMMHLAAESHVDRSIDGPEEFIQTNLVGTARLLQVARKYYDSLDEASRPKFRFLHVSTDEVYGSLGFADPAFRESTPYDPHSPYSASKAGSDHLARAWFHTFGLPVIVTNCSNNYGPYQFPEKLIPVVILKALSGSDIPVYGKGENVRDWLYVTDHARALCQVLSDGKPGETYNIGGNNEQRNLDLVRMICQLLDELKPISENAAMRTAKPSAQSYADLITFVTDRPGHDLRYAIDTSKVENELGWQPSEDFESGLRKTIRWYLENESWWQDILSGDYKLKRQGLIQASEGKS